MLLVTAAFRKVFADCLSRCHFLKISTITYYRPGLTYLPFLWLFADSSKILFNAINITIFIISLSTRNATALRHYASHVFARIWYVFMVEFEKRLYKIMMLIYFIFFFRGIINYAAFLAIRAYTYSLQLHSS